MARRLSGQALSQVCQRILDAELPDALVEGRDFRINLQSGRRPNGTADPATQPLITSISEDVWNRPSFDLFRRLLNNYTRKTGRKEVITPEEEQEVSDFLDAVLASAPMRVAHKELADRNLASEQRSEYKEQLYNIWFAFLDRKTDDDSSGFEHVFVGESDEGEVKGLHNWLQFYRLEQSGELDYRGYIFPTSRSGGDQGNTVTRDDLIITMTFKLGGETKDISSIWMGTSPEYEMAMYTLCFVAAPGKSAIELKAPSGTYDVEMRCFPMGKPKNPDYGKVGTAYGALLSKQPNGPGRRLAD